VSAGRNNPEPATEQALAQASLRILRGNPTLEEVAALATALAARARTASGGRRPHTPAGPADPTARTRRQRPGEDFRAPGAWAS